jgi:hypothetical protein
MGGLGLRRLDVLNEAILTKAFWVLLTNHHSIWAQICNAKYKGTCTWWTVDPSPANSTTVNTLLQTRTKITHKFTWRIGSGEGINVTGEPWHPAWQHSRQPTSDLSVADLWDHQRGTWKENEIRALFDNEGVAAILRLQELPRQDTLVPDKLVWLGAQNGKYSVKTGYETLMEQANGADAVESHPYWMLIWGVEVIPRVKLFMWKIGQNAIPVMSVL